MISLLYFYYLVPVYLYLFLWHVESDMDTDLFSYFDLISIIYFLRNIEKEGFPSSFQAPTLNSIYE